MPAKTALALGLFAVASLAGGGLVPEASFWDSSSLLAAVRLERLDLQPDPAPPLAEPQADGPAPLSTTAWLQGLESANRLALAPPTSNTTSSQHASTGSPAAPALPRAASCAAALPFLDDPCLEPGPGGCRRRALDGFFASLARTEGSRGTASPAFTRVLHYGDSAIAGDEITRTVRRLFQARFGDGGPGFVYLDRPWTWYSRDGVRLSVRGEWAAHNLIFGYLKDGLYGLGGMAFSTSQGGVRTQFNLAEGRLPRARLEAFFLKAPQGGTLRLSAGSRAWDVSTDSSGSSSGFFSVDLDEPVTAVALETTSWRRTRVFGVVLEGRDGGVVWDSVGIVGARATHLGNFDAAHFQEQVNHRAPDLIVLNFGLNEAVVGGLPGPAFKARQAEILARVRLAAPSTACLVVGPYDSGTFADGAVHTKPQVPRLVEAQRETALKAGCAFYDPYNATGGLDTVARWFKSKPRLVAGDFVHLTPAGAELVGKLLYDTLVGAFEKTRRCGR
jgi:lysophospholipase L1-like esterase